MAQTTVAIANKPAWIELTSSDPEASRKFYGDLFGWQIDVSPDPQYGGYAIAKIGEGDVAGIGPTQSPETPTNWGLYIGTPDVDNLAKKIEAAGGRVIAQPFEVGDQGRMAVFQDPTGAYISAWQGARMRPFHAGEINTYGWAELNARGVDQAIPFYTRVFGWTTKVSPMGEGQPPYTEFQLDGESIGGAWEMNPNLPAGVPNYWQIYVNVDDVDAAFKKATSLGATEMMAPQDFPGGRFAIITDPQGASLGLLKTQPR
jgi:predicted enzyme related to lactoylglutathione lyase